MTERKSRAKKAVAPAPPAAAEHGPEPAPTVESPDASHARHTEAFAALLHAAAKTRRTA